MTFLTISLIITLMVTLGCLWTITWLHNDFVNANLELVGNFSAGVFFTCLGAWVSTLCAKYSHIVDQPWFMTFVGICFGFSMCLAGTAVMLRSLVEVVDDFRWAFNKKKDDKK